GTAVHRTEKARTAAARTHEGWARIGVSPGNAAVSRAENLVISDAAAARSTPVAAGFVHACDVQVARDLVAGDLHVADEGTCQTNPCTPGSTVVSRTRNLDRTTAHTEVVPRDIHTSEVRRRWIVIRPPRFAVVIGSAASVNTRVMS